MEKILKFLRSYIRLFLIYLVVSLFVNWVLGENEHIAETVTVSLVTTALYTVLVHFLGKASKDS